MKWILVVCLTLSLIGVGCLKPIGRDFGSGFVEGLGKVDSISGVLARGARDTLTNAKARAELRTLLDDVGKSLSEKSGAIRDTLLGKVTRTLIEDMRDSLLGGHTQQELALIRDELLGRRTRELIGALRTEVLGDSTGKLVGALRDTLISTRTKSELAGIIDSAMHRLVMRIRTDLRPELDRELSFIQKNALLSMVALAVLCCGVVAFIYWQKAKLARVTETLLYQIHEIPDQQMYDELVARIQRKAQEKGVEPQLRKMLGKQGILGKEAWCPPPGKSRE